MDGLNGSERGWLHRLFHNHTFLMVLCCLIPILLVVAIAAFGVQNRAVYWFALILCPVSHLLMMHVHNKKGETKCH